MPPLLEIESERALEQVHGLDVAVVGNGSSILGQDYGPVIDTHDVVIRMNAGAPRPGQYARLGRRTTILSAATLATMDASLTAMANGQGSVSKAPLQVWWAKRTAWGDRQWRKLMSRDMDLFAWRYPVQWYEWASSIHAKPSSGITLLMGLFRDFKPASISTFGFDFWGVNGSVESWWYRTNPEAIVQTKCPHDGQHEFTTFKAMGFQEVTEGWWKVRL